MLRPIKGEESTIGRTSYSVGWRQVNEHRLLAGELRLGTGNSETPHLGDVLSA